MFELAWSKLLEFWGGFLTHASALLPPTNSIAAGISFALIAAVIFGGAGLMVLYIGLSGRAGFFEIIGPLIGVGGFGFWIWASVVKSAPGSYDPRHLPRDVFPE